jgi:DNA-binding transcriptional LysR family regulator
MRDEPRLDLNLLSIVVAPLDAGSASQAALDLGLSQSAVRTCE